MIFDYEEGNVTEINPLSTNNRKYGRGYFRMTEDNLDHEKFRSIRFSIEQLPIFKLKS